MMIRQRRLGQHFLNSDSIAKLIVSKADITKDDIVFEIGTGLGILTPLLCQRARKVISVDVDKQLVRDAKSRFSEIDNLVLKAGDGLKEKPDVFTIFVSNLPYSISKNAIEWLAHTSFSHGVIMVQKEFADKLLADSKRRRAISIIATRAFEITPISAVGRNNFSPPPRIDSVILKIVKKEDLTEKLIETVNKIFSYRRKTVKNILRQFNKESTITKRVDDLSGDEIISLANKILEK